MLDAACCYRCPLVCLCVCMSVVHSLEPYPRVDCHDVLVLGTRVAISDTARDLGVVIDRELSLAAHVTAVCRSSYASSDQ